MRRSASPSKAAAIAALILSAAAAAAGERVRRTGEPPSASGPETLRRIVVSLPDRKLALLEGERILRVYKTAVGAPASPTPAGTFTVINRISEPTYYGRGMVVKPGPRNPLGTRWIGLSMKGFGIHGTNTPASVGRATSHGCIRMRNRDVEELFGLVGLSVVVELRADRDDQLARIFDDWAAQPAAGTPVVPLSPILSAGESQ